MKKNAVVILVLVIGLIFSQTDLFAQSIGPSYPAGGFWQNLLVDQGARLIDSVLYSHTSPYSINGYGGGSPDPHARAYSQRMEQLRAQEFQLWRRSRELQGCQDAERDFFQSRRR